MYGKTPKGGAALGGYVSASRGLKSLDLDWNALHGEGARAFLVGLHDNGVDPGGKLRRLSLAWNRLGSGSHIDQAWKKAATTCAKVLADIFRDGEKLFHLDLFL